MLNDMTTFGTESVVGVLGDTHGDTGWTLEALDRFAEAGITHILQLGDFGIWPNHESFLRKVNNRLVKNGQILAVTLGNNENYARIAKAAPSNKAPGWTVIQGYNSILIAPRVHHFAWAGREILSVGGGNSIDRYSRVPDITWWAEEQITMGDVYRATEFGQVPLMLTHDCPDGVPLFGGHKAGDAARFLFGDAGVSYAQESRRALRAVTDVVQPKLLLHGHYHFYADHTSTFEGADSDYTMRTVGLTRDGMKKSCALLDLVSLELSILY